MSEEMVIRLHSRSKAVIRLLSENLVDGIYVAPPNPVIYGVALTQLAWVQSNPDAFLGLGSITGHLRYRIGDLDFTLDYSSSPAVQSICTVTGPPGLWMSWDGQRFTLEVEDRDYSVPEPPLPPIHLPKFFSNIAPAAVSWGPDRIDVFAIDTNSNMIHGWWSENAWHGWDEFVTGIEEIVALSNGPGQLDIFGCYGVDKIYWWRYREKAGWPPGPFELDRPPGLQRLVGCFTSADNISLFGVGQEGGLLRRDYDEMTGWSAWIDLGIPTKGVGVASMAPGRVDLFGASDVGTLSHWWQTGVEELRNGQLPAGITGVPTAASWGQGRLDILATSLSTPQQLEHSWYEGGLWGTWEQLGVSPGSTAVAMSTWGPGRLDLFTVGNSRLYHRWFSNGWHHWEEPYK